MYLANFSGVCLEENALELSEGQRSATIKGNGYNKVMPKIFTFEKQKIPNKFVGRPSKLVQEENAYLLVRFWNIFLTPFILTTPTITNPLPNWGPLNCILQLMQLGILFSCPLPWRTGGLQGFSGSLHSFVTPSALYSTPLEIPTIIWRPCRGQPTSYCEPLSEINLNKHPLLIPLLDNKLSLFFFFQKSDF